MQLLSNEVKGYLGNASMIRRMFEAGIELKRTYGEDNVYDFSLGNPDLPPPPEIKTAMQEIAENSDQPFAFGYMPNAGENSAREALSQLVSDEQELHVPAANIVVTCGAAGGINAFFRATLTPGDEVICIAPYFVEYGFYAGNFGGILKPVMSNPDFSLNIDNIAAAINPKTRAIILNSPNNPTGKIYNRTELDAVAKLLTDARKKYGRMIYIVSDEPYRFLNYDGTPVPSMFKVYDGTVVIGSFSKTLSLPGARIGYVAVNPNLENCSELIGGLTLTNRTLGFVNAPVVAQKLIAKCINARIDLDVYRRRRNLMAQILTDAGIEFIMPGGAFYFFPKSPVPDEKIFINALLKERILAVPGSGFGMPGYFRLAFCVSEKIIAASAPSFSHALTSFRGEKK
ncbi:MAG: pyridoxal phosphate-dependent aminotransferase [Lentisphaerae bacterium]|nr:pyridoxal phosphate-dependent aminotransferase [Lentisphaerota bacterium]